MEVGPHELGMNMSVIGVCVVGFCAMGAWLTVHLLIWTANGRRVHVN